ncbi:MAG: type III pantothenate kinase [Mycoplasmatales bacterium]
MFLLIDAGNTRIKMFLYNPQTKEVVPTIVEDRHDFARSLNCFEMRGDIEKVLLASVVPSINSLVISFFDNTLIFDYQYFAKFMDFGELDYREMGSDRVVAICAALKQYGDNLILFDLGTALKVEVLKAGKYESGYIFPGLDLTRNALIGKTEQLNNFKYGPVTDDNHCLDTYSQLNDGIIYGMVGAIKQFINLAQNHFTNEQYKIIMTGGGCEFLELAIPEIEQILECQIDHNLIRDGLIQIGEELLDEKRDD